MEVYALNSSDSSSSVGKITKKEGKTVLRKPCNDSQKSPLRPWKKKPPVAPLPRTPAMVYKVEPDKFREVVQMLTGADPELIQPPQERHEITKLPPPAPIITDDILEACRYRVYLQETSLNEHAFPWKFPAHESMAEPDSIGAPHIGSSSMYSHSGWDSSIPILSPDSLSTFDQEHYLDESNASIS